MGEFVGATPDELRSLARDFRAAADRFDAQGAGVLGFLRQLAWQGPIAIAFREAWDRRHRREIAALGHDLRDMASVLTRQADEQLRASGKGAGRSWWGGIASTIGGWGSGIRNGVAQFGRGVSDWVSGTGLAIEQGFERLKWKGSRILAPVLGPASAVQRLAGRLGSRRARDDRRRRTPLLLEEPRERRREHHEPEHQPGRRARRYAAG